MTEQIDPHVLEAARQAALADPGQFGGAYALLLADHSQELIRAGEWQASVQLLDLAQAFARRAGADPSLAGGTKVGRFPRAGRPAIPAVATKTGLAQLAGQTLLLAVRALPSEDPLGPAGKSRLGRRLLQGDLTSARDLAVVEKAVALCSAAVDEAPDPDAELLANLGQTLRARFELTARRADIDASIGYLAQASDMTAAEDPAQRAVVSDLGDALLAAFEATGETRYLDDCVVAMRLSVERTPPWHADRPVMLSNLGASLLSRFERFADAEDLAGAEQYLREAWTSGGGRRDIICTNLGTALLKRYELTGAEVDLDAAVSVLTEATRLTPAGSPEHLSALSPLAEAHSAAGLSAARELLSEVVLGRERAFGTEHPSTLEARHNLATVMALLGHCLTAAEELRVILAARVRVLGLHHPDTLATRHNLAAALADLGRDAEARAELQTVVADRTAVLGPDHPDTQASLRVLEEIHRP